MNYGWLDPSDKGYIDNYIGAARFSRHGALLCLAQIWEIFTEVENCGDRGGKSWLVGFFNPLDWCSSNKSLSTCLGVVDSGYVDTQTQRVELYSHLSTSVAQIVDCHPWLSTTDNPRVKCCAVYRHAILAVEKAHVLGGFLIGYWLCFWSIFRSVGFLFFMDSLRI